MNLAVVIDCVDRIRFFSRFKTFETDRIFALTEHQYLSDLSSIETTSSTSSIAGILFDKRIEEPILEKMLDYHLKGRLSAKLSFFNGVRAIEKLNKTYKIEHILIWNGAQAFASGVAHYANNNGIKLLYLEIGNVPNKIFIDPIGVNCRSLIYQNPSIIDKIVLDDNFKQQWLETYINHLAKGAQPKQKDIKPPQISTWQVFKSSPINIFLSLKNRIFRSNRSIGSFEGTSWNQPLPEDYIFVPLQVSTDTQILLNSKFNNKSLLTNLLGNSNQQYVIKFHPCDSKQSIKQLLKIIKQFSNVTINQGSTYSLISKSQKVVTINSTVGLEALILGKPVEFYGMSLFAHFDRERAIKYASTYLFDLNYFDSDEISPLIINDMLSFHQKYIFDNDDRVKH